MTSNYDDFIRERAAKSLKVDKSVDKEQRRKQLLVEEDDEFKAFEDKLAKEKAEKKEKKAAKKVLKEGEEKTEHKSEKKAHKKDKDAEKVDKTEIKKFLYLSLRQGSGIQPGLII